MAGKLKPCPFCGGEAHIDSDYSSELDHTFWQVWHDCDTNPGPVRHTYGHALGMKISTPWCASEDAAVALWNRRAERTCRVVVSHGSHGPEPRFPGDVWTMHHVCSACGGPVDRGDRYCRNCGARLADNDKEEA